MGLARFLRHRWLDEDAAQRALGEEALNRLEQRVQKSEAAHSGEVFLCIESGLPLSYLWRNAPPRERALAMFSKLGVWNTEANNGVLIYLLLADHAIEVVADRGLSAHVPQSHWDRVVADLSAALRAKDLEGGLARAIDEVTEQLVRHFPLAPGQRNPNELPNRPVFR